MIWSPQLLIADAVNSANTASPRSGIVQSRNRYSCHGVPLATN